MSYLTHIATPQRFDDANKADGGDGGGAPDAAATQAAIQAAVETATSVLKSRNDELLGKVKALTTDNKRFEGIDPDQVRKMLSHFENDAEAKLIAEGKIPEVIDKRTEKLRADFEKQIKEGATKAEQAEARAAKFSQRVLDNHIRAASAKAGIHQHAIDDALFRGRVMFALDENGDAVQLGGDGRPVFGKDGKTPFSPLEWLENMKETAPHWFPSRGPGGGASNHGTVVGAKQMQRTAFDALPPKQRAAKMADGYSIVE